MKALFLITCLITGVTVNLLEKYLEKYLFSDWQFIGFLGILMVIDTVLGIVKHWKNHTVSSQGFSKVFTKCLIYGALLIVVHVLTNFKVDGTVSTAFGWIDDTVYAGMLLREAISILENMAAIDSRLMFPGILKRLQQFDSESGKFIKPTKEQDNGAN